MRAEPLLLSGRSRDLSWAAAPGLITAIQVLPCIVAPAQTATQVYCYKLPGRVPPEQELNRNSTSELQVWVSRTRNWMLAWLRQTPCIVGGCMVGSLVAGG